MRLLDKYIIYSSVFSLFTEDFSFHYIIDWKLFYILLLSNFILLSINKRLTVHKNIVILLLFFLIHGVVNFIVFLNPISSLIAQFLGISISSIFFYNLIKIYKTPILFKTYLDVALILAIIAIPMFYFNINTFTYNRLNGILTEPAHYAAIMLPAVYVFLRQKKYYKLSIIVFTILLTKSSVGFIGLFLITILPLLKVKYFLKYALLTIILIAIGAYYISTKWNEPISENESNTIVRRLKQTNESSTASYTGKFKEDTNLSSYAFLSNLYITQQIFFHKPLGTGLGSYKHEYDKYYEKLSPPKYLVTMKQTKMNRTDANSLFFRIIADFGVFGLIMLGYFFYRSFTIFRVDKNILIQGAFFYLIIKLIREGHYFPPEFYFFLLIFLSNHDENTSYS